MTRATTVDTGRLRILVVEHEDGAGPGLVGERLRAAGLDTRVHRPWRGEELPGSLDGWSGLIVLGGSVNCEDDTAAPWLPRVRALIREAVEARIPVLGICLGGQLLAHALGGRVAVRALGPELGTVPLRRLPAADDDPLFGTLPEGAPAAQWHWDEIDRLPPAAVPLLTGDDCRHQAFRAGACAWGVQFHPEALTGTIAGWAAADAPRMRADGLDPDGAVASVREAEPRLRAVWGAVADAWAGVVRAGLRDARAGVAVAGGIAGE
ncbi:type 1 glutamine amidotransferase [Streptomyces sp. NPDC004327]|uniref:type 1 glutamine amidotransferase n=1 Tax=Streptomyces sp. NPDC004327 TaxID=3364699 RepID=UPI00368A9788